MTTTQCPSEDSEQQAFVKWLDLRNIPFWHTNNEYWTSSWKQKTRAKAMGVKSGIPDLFLVFNEGIVGIEMKRRKGGVVSPTQKYWAQVLKKANIDVFVCRGADNAVETVEYLLKNGYTTMSIQPYNDYVLGVSAKKEENRLKRLKNKKNDEIF